MQPVVGSINKVMATGGRRDDAEREPFGWDMIGHETTFVENMVTLRTRLGISQTELARRLANDHGLPFHQPTLQRIESGERPLKLTEAIVIANLLGSDLQTMMDDVSAEFGYRTLIDELTLTNLNEAVEDVVRIARHPKYRADLIREAVDSYVNASEQLNLPIEASAVEYAERVEKALRQLQAECESLTRFAEDIRQRIADEPRNFPDALGELAGDPDGE